ncbi:MULTISPECIES: geobacillin-26 family protein [Bacteria]|uniref:geobacillin-26 family protein n=1 Tax=Bacillota TaxID=1239 RepID=UPI001CC586CD|nr:MULTISPECIES: geobacillin-26 family protein [Bacillota]MDT7918882.1 geobacillin-26 family protein [Clostridium perfringens]MDT7927891.1 geobacillin-26 family protein [Clostridium perfringens]MDT7938457.1 geobacillin-26 family protein [Clostridium perfringens]MDT8012375.1 geobacillin-26 family protein [Clostridium perfringens]GJG92739.1 hypothetical protein EFL1_28790 [Enterococcus faecium]
MIKKDKFLKRGIAISLASISIALPVTNTVYAMEPESATPLTSYSLEDNIKVNVLEDNDERKTVEVVEGNKVSTSTFDKKNNTLAVEVKSGDTILQKSFVDENSSIDIDQKSMAQARAVESVKCMYSKLKYSINMKSWTITNSKGSVKKRPETNSHKDYLYRFRDAVKSSRQSENAARASLDGASISIVMGSITAATGVGAVIAAVGAVGGSLSAAYNIWDSVVARREADRYFAIL